MIATLALTMLTSLAFADDAPTVDAGTQAIVNGKEINKGRFPAATAIGFSFQGQTQSTCTASLITPRILLTAAHCTEEYIKYGLPETAINQFGAAFFTDEVGGSNQTTVGFEEFRNHPRYSGGQTSIRNDVGVVVLREKVKGVRPVWFRTEPLRAKEALDAKVISVGYGITSSASQNSSGVKRFANLVVDDIDDQFLYSLASTNPNESNVCSGDSGGPQYHRYEDGRLEQWAVHSFVFAADFRASDPCLSASGSTNVSEFSDWILEQVEDVHGSTDHCDINGYYEDLICDPDCADPDPDCQLDLDGDGMVSEQELDAADANGDGVIDDDEYDVAVSGAGSVPGACSTTGGVPLWLPLLGLGALALRRRED